MSPFKLKIRLNQVLISNVKAVLTQNTLNDQVDVNDRIVFDAKNLITNELNNVTSIPGSNVKLFSRSLESLTVIINALNQVIKAEINTSPYQALKTELINSKDQYYDTITDLTFNNLITVNNRMQVQTNDRLVGPMIIMDKFYPSLTTAEILEMQSQIITDYAFKLNPNLDNQTEWDNDLRQRQKKAITSIIRLTAFENAEFSRKNISDLESQIYIGRNALRTDNQKRANRSIKAFQTLIKAPFSKIMI